MDRADPEALAELYRTSLLAALEDCTEPLSGTAGLTEEDHHVLELWKEGLHKSAKHDPWWKAMLDEVWGLREDTDTRPIDNFIVRLRRYLEDDPTRPRYLLTVRGVGYRFIAFPAAGPQQK